MNKIASIQKEIIENFKLLDEWEDKYEYLLDISKNQETLADEFKTKGNLVNGCQSRVWVIAKNQDGLIHFESDSDAPIPQALANVVSKILTNNEPLNIVNAEVNFHKKTDLILYLSPARAKGLESIIKKFKTLALKHIKNDINV